METITTTLEREWFAKIVDRSKRIEYREIKSYWTSRLSKVQAPFRSFMAQPHIKRGSLVSLFDNWRRPSQPVQLVYPANRHLSAKLRVFVDWVVEAFAARLSTTKLPGNKSIKR